MVRMTSCSLRTLFFVSILHSSQKTRESLLFGSEWVLKHFRQIECPQTKVSGSFKYSKQERQLSVESNCSTCFLFLCNNLTSSFFNFSPSSTFSSNFLYFSFNFSYLLFNFEISAGKAFCISYKEIFSVSRSLILAFKCSLSFSWPLIYSFSFSIVSFPFCPSVSRSLSCLSSSATFLYKLSFSLLYYEIYVSCLLFFDSRSFF